MKRTAFYQKHIELGARIIPFAGFEMPVEYSGILDEHRTVRIRAGLFDVSHMGEIWVSGPEAFGLIQRLTTNDVAKLVDGKVQYSCLPNGKGGIVDDLLVYRFGPEKYLLVVNASNMEKDWNWIKTCNTEGADLHNASGETSQLAIQGPAALMILQKLTDTDLSALSYYSFTIGNIAGVEEVIISATGYTGAGGFELYFPNDKAEQLWDAIMEAGKEEGLKPIGLAARDTLRLEMGYCLYGNDIDDHTSPLEAGLGWITRFVEGNDFLDREYLEEQKAKGIRKKLTGFELLERGIPRQHYPVVNKNGELLGEVTSGTMSPMLNKGIGMAYVPVEYSLPGSTIFIRIRNKDMEAKVVKLPFYQEG